MQKSFRVFCFIVVAAAINIALVKNVSAVSGFPSFTHNLKLGSVSPDVILLQEYLNSQGFTVADFGPGSSGNETDQFGAATQAALEKFQDHYAAEILVPQGLTQGTGNFYAVTRNFINGLLQKENTDTPASSGAAISSAASMYTVGGQITGISAETILEDNGSDDVTINPGQSSVFAFSRRLASGQGYSVTVKQAPAGEHCYALSSGNNPVDVTGTINSGNVTNIQIMCGSYGDPFLTVSHSGKSASLTTPTINFSNITETYGAGPFNLSATSNSIGAFSYTSNNSSVATVSNGVCTIVGVGTSIISAQQAAAGNYAAGLVSATLTVNPITPTITFNNFSENLSVSPVTLSATSNSTGTISYTSSNTAVATVSANTLTIVGAGTSIITAMQAASGNYATGSQAATLTVTDPCNPNICQNGGTCEDVSGSFECVCTPCYMDITCTQVNEACFGP